jgi:transcription factor MYB, plant
LRYHENEPKSKRPWTEREDELLRALIQRLGVGLWAAVAEHIPSRTGKQVRERWLNHLSPQVFKRPWSPAEDRIIIEAHKLYGNSWSKICKLLDGRSENMCKNRFHCKLSKLQTVSGERDAGARTVFGNLPPRRTLRKY